RGITRRCRTPYPDRLVTIVSNHLNRTLIPIRSDEGRQGHHGALIVTHVHLQDVVDAHTMPLLGLHPYALHPAAIREFTHVARAQGGRILLRDLTEMHAQRRRLVATNGKTQLRSRP